MLKVFIALGFSVFLACSAHGIPNREIHLSGKLIQELEPQGTYILRALKEDRIVSMIVLDRSGEGTWIEDTEIKFDYKIFPGEEGWVIFFDELKSEIGPDGDPRGDFPKKIKRTFLIVDRKGLELTDPFGRSFFQEEWLLPQF